MKEIRAADVDGDGTIDRTELEALLMVSFQGWQEEENTEGGMTIVGASGAKKKLDRKATEGGVGRMLRFFTPEELLYIFEMLE